MDDWYRPKTIGTGLLVPKTGLFFTYIDNTYKQSNAKIRYFIEIENIELAITDT